MNVPNSYFFLNIFKNRLKWIKDPNLHDSRQVLSNWQSNDKSQVVTDWSSSGIGLTVKWCHIGTTYLPAIRGHKVELTPDAWPLG